MSSKLIKCILAISTFSFLIFLMFWDHRSRKYETTSLGRVRHREEASPEWDIGDMGQVRLLVENTERYNIDTEEGTRDWESLVPDDDGIVYLPNPETGELEQYTISLFHELRCLNVIRLELIRPTRFESRTPNEPLVKHCLNYVRQMVLCRSDMYLENVRDPVGPAADITHVRTCRDWRKVYEAVEGQNVPSALDADLKKAQ